MTRRRWLLVPLVTACAVLIALVIGDAWPKKAAVGIPDAGVAVAWVAILLRVLVDLSSLLVVGLLVHLLFVLSDSEGNLPSAKARSILEVASLVWLVSLIGRLVVGLADELGISLPQALDGIVLRSYLTQTSIGRYLLAQLILVSILVPALALVKRWISGFFILATAGVALVLPALIGHSAGSGNHSLALGSISIHLWAVSAWVGVVCGLWLDQSNPHRASAIAFGAAVAVALTGTVNTLVRFTQIADIQTGYGQILVVKTLMLASVLAVGFLARRKVRANTTLSAVVGPEILLMTSIIGISAVLSQTPPPIPRDLQAISPVQELTGARMPLPPTLPRLFTTWSWDGFTLALCIVMVVSYLVGVRTLRRRGDHWPFARSIMFLAGTGVFFFASNGGLAAYAKVAFSFHMLSHMLIVTLAPIGIVLGAPMTLALRTLPKGDESSEQGLRGHLQRVLNSRTVWLISHPIWALIVFDGSLFGFYFSGLFSHLMRWHLGHSLMDLHFLAVGVLFFYVIIGVDPNPHKTPYLVRIVLLLAAMSLHAFFSVALMSTSQLLDNGYYDLLQRPWSANLLADQHLGGSLGWALGEVPIVLALIATFIQWVQADDREARRIDRAAARAESRGQEDELAMYNAYLRALAEKDPDRKS